MNIGKGKYNKGKGKGKRDTPTAYDTKERGISKEKATAHTAHTTRARESTNTGKQAPKEQTKEAKERAKEQGQEKENIPQQDATGVANKVT